MRLLSAALLVTLAAQIATGPLIVYHFGRLSVISLLTNLLILPVQPMVMMAGGLATLVGMAWLPLACTVRVVDWTAAAPLASVSLGHLSPWLLAAIYAGWPPAVVWRASRAPRHDERESVSPTRGGLSALRVSTRMMFAGGAVAVVLVWLAGAALPDGHLHVAFLDVGQGDAVLITTPSGRQILIDGGPSATATLWEMGRHSSKAARSRMYPLLVCFDLSRGSRSISASSG